MSKFCCCCCSLGWNCGVVRSSFPLLASALFQITANKFIHPMEYSSILLPLSHQISFFPPKHYLPRTSPTPPPHHHQWRKQRTRQQLPTRLFCHKMFVPGFGEASPEAKAAKNLHSFFTYVAVKIVLAQLESYNPEGHEELMEFVSRNSLNDGDEFCANLMRESSRHKGLALRILEVRSAYCKRDFEWDNLKTLAIKMVDKSNTSIMRDYVLETSHVENENR